MRLTVEETNAVAQMAKIMSAPANRDNKELQSAWDGVAAAIGRIYGAADSKPLTSDEQDFVEYQRTRRYHDAAELEVLFRLIDRLPRGPRKKTLGQVLYEQSNQSKRYAWETLDPSERAYREQAARAIVAEYEKRKAAGAAE